MTVKKTTILFDELKLIDNIYIYCHLLYLYAWNGFNCNTIYQYLTVNHVLVILMYIHKSCNNALLFSLIERTQNAKTKTLSLRDINHRVEIVRRNVA